MDHITQQLRWVRRAGRAMLVTQRVGQWLTAMAVVTLVLVTADYLLRLPGAMRLMLGVATAGMGTLWLAGRLRRAAGFRPTLSDIALRAERLYPTLRGRLTSAVDFTEHAPDYENPALTAAMARTAVDEARQLAAHLPLRKLIDPTLTVRIVLATLAAALIVGTLAAISPAHATTAAKRWLMPLGDTEWPRRVNVDDATDARVWPIDTALPLRARVVRGGDDGLRVWAQYRVRRGGEPGAWQRTIMTRTPNGTMYETLVEPGGLTSPGDDDATLEYYFVAGDDRTPAAKVVLTQRPAVIAASVTISPPHYASGLIDDAWINLHEQAGPVASAAGLRHSRVTLNFQFNKTLPMRDAADMLNGLDLPYNATHAERASELSVTFELTETVTLALQLTDDHGLTSLSPRRYRLEAIDDRPPNVALLEPAADESVLPTAIVPIDSAAQDDVAVAHLSLEAAAQGLTRTLAESTGRQGHMTLAHALDLSALNVAPGDHVTLTAIARDVYFDGADRAAVRSGERHLRIIGDAQLVEQLRADLAAVRQQAIRMERTQARLMDAENPADTRGEQAQLTQRLSAQRGLVQRLGERARRNRLDEPALDQLLAEAGRLLDEAQRRSEAAESALADQPQQAATEQEAARAAMAELADLLDQGQDALTLQLALRGLAAQQEQLAQQTRELLPQTVGRDVNDLPQELRDQVNELAERQRQAAETANQLVRDMQSSAQALNRQGENDRDRAAAEAMAEAAAIAQRQGLEQDMREASQQVGQNQLSQAGQQQSDAQRTLAQMAEAVGSQQQRQAEMLKRRLLELAQLLEKLIERQTAQLDALAKVEDDAGLAALAPPMGLLRRTTLGAEEVAARSQETAALTEAIGKAVNEQGRAVGALENAVKTEATDAEQTALDQLQRALAAVRERQRQQRAEQAQQDRARLRQAYERLAAQQQELNGQIAALLDSPRLDRRQQADLRGGEAAQAAIRKDADLLWSDVGSTLIFNRLHEKIDAAAQRVERQLAAGSTDTGIRADQVEIHSALRLMAAALEQQTKSEQFDRPAGDGQGGGGGGGDSGPSSAEQAVPPLAELRLLREMQQRVYDTTRALAGEPSRDTLMRLADDQQELADLGARLKEMAEQQMGGAR